MQTILMVEDDEKLRKELSIFLTKNGYEVKTLQHFNNPIEDIIDCQCDLVLLDINLPNFDGEYICKEIRKTSDIPIAIMTSRNNEMDELISMNYGADDFITKPFNPQILLARIAAILKRMQPSDKNQTKIETKEFTLDISQSIIQVGEKKQELTKNELKILYLLLKNQNKIVSREEIMTYLWDSQMFVDDNTLTVNMTRLRSKLEELGLPNKIETKRGQGYLLSLTQ